MTKSRVHALMDDRIIEAVNQYAGRCVPELTFTGALSVLAVSALRAEGITLTEPEQEIQR